MGLRYTRVMPQNRSILFSTPDVDQEPWIRVVKKGAQYDDDGGFDAKVIGEPVGNSGFRRMLVSPRQGNTSFDIREEDHTIYFLRD